MAGVGNNVDIGALASQAVGGGVVVRLSRHRRPDRERDGVLARLSCLVFCNHSIWTENIMAKAHRGLDGRHRDKSGKIDKKHGNTRVASLRKEYGASFAKGRRKDMMLKT